MLLRPRMSRLTRATVKLVAGVGVDQVVRFVGLLNVEHADARVADLPGDPSAHVDGNDPVLVEPDPPAVEQLGGDVVPAASATAAGNARPTSLLHAAPPEIENLALEKEVALLRGSSKEPS